MNRETKRRLGGDGDGGGRRRPPAPATGGRGGRRGGGGAPKGPRGTPVSFVKDIRGELRRVAWPTRSEVINYSAVVLGTLVVVVLLIFFIDLAFQEGVTFLFDL